jgi:hypothetical protein
MSGSLVRVSLSITLCLVRCAAYCCPYEWASDDQKKARPFVIFTVLFSKTPLHGRLSLPDLVKDCWSIELHSL